MEEILKNKNLKRDQITIKKIIKEKEINENKNDNNTIIWSIPKNIKWDKINDYNNHRFMFFEHELEYNITGNKMISLHEIISIKELPKNIRKEKLPYIKSYDPIIRIINAKPNDIIKIYRRTPFNSEEKEKCKDIYYRIVIDKKDEKQEKIINLEESESEEEK